MATNSLVFVIVAVGVASFGYFLPWIIAVSRGHHNQGGIFILNLLTAWTGIGWFVALVMACGTVDAVAHERTQKSAYACPDCKIRVKEDEAECPSCGARLNWGDARQQRYARR